MEPFVPVERKITDGRATRLFLVQNTAFNHTYVLAVDSLVAAAIAKNAGHVRKIFNAHSKAIDLADLAKAEPKFAASVSEACKSGLQGVLSKKDGCVIVGRHVFSPEGEV